LETKGKPVTKNINKNKAIRDGDEKYLEKLVKEIVEQLTK
jgi:hypothetical protein